MVTIHILAQTTIPVVHTTGINPWSLVPIIVAVVGCAIGVASYVDNRGSKRQLEIKTEITESVNHLSEVLVERLETKENVALLRERVARLERNSDSTKGL